MRTWTLCLAVLWMTIGWATAQQPGKAVPDLEGLKGRNIPGFTLKKTTAVTNKVVEIWQRDADAAQLRIEIIPKANVAMAESRLKAVNAKIGTQGQQGEELMFRYQSSGQNLGWTNYRATHHITFKTYRSWKFRNSTLVMADLSFTRGKPDFDAARGAFVAASKATDSTLKALGLL